MTGDLLRREVGALLDDLSREQVPTAGGAAAAMAATFAAALVTMAGRASRERWPDAGGAIAQAEALRARLPGLAASNADAYNAARALLLRTGADREHHGAPAAPSAGPEPDREELRRRLDTALATAAEVPLLIAEAASEVAEVAGWAAGHVNADVRADAVVAVTLAEAATRAAAHLVSINLGTRPDDERARRAAEACDRARAAVEGA